MTLVSNSDLFKTNFTPHEKCKQYTEIFFSLLFYEKKKISRTAPTAARSPRRALEGLHSEVLLHILLYFFSWMW